MYNIEVLNGKHRKSVRYAMCAVILIFAFTMSLVINVVERTIATHFDEEKTRKSEAEEILVRDKAE